MHKLLMRCLAPLVLGSLLMVALPARAGPIAFDTWMEFGFTDPGIPATGCDPADPAGPFCLPSSGTPTQFLDAPPWTFTAAGSALLTVTDAFLSGDRFEVFDSGASLGLTSVPVPDVDCGDDPVPCLANVAVSHASFMLAAGLHSITIVAVDSPGGGGSGYLIVSGRAVPEPTTLLLLAVAILALRLGVRRGPH